jgi:glucosyl-3-phosphoglycerate synthase
MNENARRWCDRRTFNANAFDTAELITAKGSSRVSVVIPARDEAATIGGIVERIHSAHVQGTRLVDELLVIDSDSADGTADVARDAGATVYSAAQIRPDLGWRPGKGEAMWKSLFVSTGDIVVFIDADLTTFTPDYVTGLLGPLLSDPDIALVKGFYDRALDGAEYGIAQGGRVTELMARPVINLWWPDLAGVIQPLAGEWAARRSLLEALPFPSGYGIEIAVLIDTCESRGLDALAQVDLGVRGHIHQDLASLSVVAAEVVAAATARKFDAPMSDRAEIAHLARVQGTETREWLSRTVNSMERPPRSEVS